MKRIQNRKDPSLIGWTSKQGEAVALALLRNLKPAAMNKVINIDYERQTFSYHYDITSISFKKHTFAVLATILHAVTTRNTAGF